MLPGTSATEGPIRWRACGACLAVAFASLSAFHGAHQAMAGDPKPSREVPLFEMMAPSEPMTARQKDMMSLDMSSRATMGVSMSKTLNPVMVEKALTHGMHGDRAETPPPLLRIPLNATSSVAVRRTSITHEGDHYVWRGEVEGSGQPVTLMWWSDGHVSGSIRHGSRLFMVKGATGGMHEVVEIARRKLPPDHAPANSDILHKMGMHQDPLVRQGDASMMRSMMEKAGMMSWPRMHPTSKELDKLRDGPAATPDEAPVRRSARPEIDHSTAGSNAQKEDVTISLMVAYTPAVARHYEDPARDLVALAVEEANQSFRNSGLGHIHVKLVHTYETGYAESGTHFEHVWRFADKGDGYMDEVHALRDKHKAAVAVLMVHDPMGCGLATRVRAEADEAFAVVHHECATSTYSLAHEIGHIIGARHDYALDDTITPFPFGHGYVHGNRWRTMMSYKDTCNDCPRLPVWSSPSVKVRGVPAGTARHDNAKVIAEQAGRVARFR